MELTASFSQLTYKHHIICISMNINDKFKQYAKV